MSVLHVLLHDLRLAGRVLGRNRLSSALAILCFGIGLAAAATLIAVTNAVIVAALPYKDPSTLVSVRAERRETAHSAFSSTEFLDYQREARTIDGLAAFMQWDDMVDRSGRHLVKGAGVSPTFFRVLGVDAILGRTFQPGETGSSRVAVVSWNFWQRRFAGLPQAIGSRLDLDGRVSEVIGIMPRSFRHLNDDDIDVWTLWGPGGDRLNRRFSIVGRLASGASLRAARAELNVIAARLEKEYPTSNAGWRIQLIPLMEATIGQIRPMIALLALAVGFLLAVALIDVMHLLLAHSIVGGREFAIRLAIGATTWQLVRQAVIQSMLLSSAGAALGILFSRALVPQIASLGGSYVPRIVNASVDHNVLIFTVALAVLLGVVSGTATGLRIANVDVQPLLIEGPRQMGGRMTTKLYRALLTSQIALTLLLSVSGAVLIKNFNSLRQIDLGFTPNNVWLVQVRVPPELALSSSEYSPQLFRSILARLAGLPQIDAAAGADPGPSRPLPAALMLKPSILGETSAASQPVAGMRVVAGNYFRVMGIRIAAGRVFTEDDDGRGVVIVSRSLARSFPSGRNPLSMRILLRELREVEPRRVVGVVDDVRDSALGEPQPALYVPDLRLRRLDFSFLVRTRSVMPDAGASVQSQIREIEESLYVGQPIKLQDVAAQGLTRPRFVMTISVLLAVAALLLASVGIGGVLYFLTTQRIHELGIRMALGSNRTRLRRMLVVQQLRPVAAGITIGAVAAYVLAPLMATQLHSDAPRDLGAFGAAVSAVFLAAVVACYLAALQATNIDVVQALRRE